MSSPDRGSDIDQRFVLQKLLGEGAYGKVYKAIDKKTNKVSSLSPKIYCIFNSISRT
jgi:serine/threonine protein kinase